jgi:septal ring-binding cell division protein DamX
VKRDESEAARWLEQAASRGVAPAQYNLGVLYEHGRGVRLDAHQALQWYGRAAAQGYERARVRLAALEARLGSPRASAGVDPATRQPVPEAPAVSSAPAAGATPPGLGQAAATPAAAQTPDPVTPAPAQPASTVVAPAGASGSDWLATRDPARYTLQLASFTSEPVARRFIRQLPSDLPARYYAATKRGKRWFSVIYGDFADYPAAEAAVRGLAQRLREMKPWIRRLGRVQDELD